MVRGAAAVEMAGCWVNGPIAARRSTIVRYTNIEVGYAQSK